MTMKATADKHIKHTAIWNNFCPALIFLTMIISLTSYDPQITNVAPMIL
jgi:hypothetical protein